jgi:hypothetical protein
MDFAARQPGKRSSRSPLTASDCCRSRDTPRRPAPIRAVTSFDARRVSGVRGTGSIGICRSLEGLVMKNADLATNFGAGLVNLACRSFSGEVYEMVSRLATYDNRSVRVCRDDLRPHKRSNDSQERD